MDIGRLYEIAIQTRNVEIHLFWQRSNYFLVLNTAIGTGFFVIGNEFYGVVLATVGLSSAFLWFLVNLGGKYWQSRWEEHTSLIERNISERIVMFNSDNELNDILVRRSLNVSKKKDHTLLGKAILSKPSVSRIMTILSMIFILLWALLLGYKLAYYMEWAAMPIINKMVSLGLL